MSEKSEVVFDPQKDEHVGITPLKIEGRKPFLRQVPKSNWRGNQTPRQLVSQGLFSETVQSTYGQKRAADGEFAAWRALRTEYPKRLAAVTPPRPNQRTQRQAYMNELLINKLGEEETRQFKRTATDPLLAHYSSPADLSVVRNQPRYEPKLNVRRAEIPL